MQFIICIFREYKVVVEYIVDLLRKKEVACIITISTFSNSNKIHACNIKWILWVINLVHKELRQIQYHKYVCERWLFSVLKMSGASFMAKEPNFGFLCTIKEIFVNARQGRQDTSYKSQLFAQWNKACNKELRFRSLIWLIFFVTDEPM